MLGIHHIHQHHHHLSFWFSSSSFFLFGFARFWIQILIHQLCCKRMVMAVKSQFHVLAVDDSVIDRKLIEKLLKTSSYQGNSISLICYRVILLVFFFSFAFRFIFSSIEILYLWVLNLMGILFLVCFCSYCSRFCK